MKNILLLAISLFGFGLKAAPGDTTWVGIHNNTQMTWYERYTDKALFPDGSKTYHKILMYYTLGCANGGCSDWDYTTRVTLLQPTGNIDSNIASIDTLSQSPLIIDTTWQQFEVKEPYELARVITPYGNGLSNNWTHDFVYDLTDFYALLKDSVEIEVFYQGWSAGFSATLNFAFIEGPRPREITKIENLYMGRGDYLNSADFEQTHLPSKNVSIAPNTTGMSLRANFSGHGFVNALNCAEFCQKDYYVKVNGQTAVTQSIWRDDCGLNPIWPQGGTWLYDRANWCPGDKSLFHHHILDTYVSGNTAIDLDVDIEAYSYTVPSGQVPAGYNYAVQLIQYGDPGFAHDAELERILAPSDEDELGRLNPSCRNAIVKIKNKGSEPLTSCTVRYGLKGQAWETFQWTGNLTFGESEVVELPFGEMKEWYGLSGYNLTFEASVENPNGVPDENALNNRYYSNFEAPETFPGKLQFNLRTNNRGNETHWTLEALDGTVLQTGDNLSANTTYNYTFDLVPGCYFLSVKDRSKNGLSFFGNNDGNGFIQLKNDGGSFFFKNLNANFGTELRQYFTVGYTIGLPEDRAQSAFFNVYPNPAQKHIHVELISPRNESVSLSILDIHGKNVFTDVWPVGDTQNKVLNVEHLAPGLYTIELVTGNTLDRQKLILR